MSLKEITKSMCSHTADVYDTLEVLGLTLPEDKNLANLVDVLDGLSPAPAVPVAPTSFAELKEAVDAGKEIIVGTEIPDIYGGASNPMIVAQQLNSTNNSAYGNVVGVILVRKYAGPRIQWAVYPSTSFDYSQSNVASYLSSTYYNGTSSDLKNIMSDIVVPTRFGNVTAKWFEMSAVEVGGTADGEGFFWDYWKNKTGLSVADNSSNSGRIITDMSGVAKDTFLRSTSSSQVRYIYATGQIGSYDGGEGPWATRSILPACFVAQGS